PRGGQPDHRGDGPEGEERDQSPWDRFSGHGRGARRDAVTSRGPSYGGPRKIRHADVCGASGRGKTSDTDRMSDTGRATGWRADLTSPSPITRLLRVAVGRRGLLLLRPTRNRTTFYRHLLRVTGLSTSWVG